MQRGRLMRVLGYPPPEVEAVLRVVPDYRLALAGDAAALRRLGDLVRGAMALRAKPERVTGDESGESGGEGRGKRPHRRFRKAGKADGRAAAAMARLARTDVESFRAAFVTPRAGEAAVWVETLAVGTDAWGLWADVMINVPWLRPTNHAFRFRREPLALESPEMPPPQARATPGTFADLLLGEVRRVAHRYGWSELEAALFILEARVPLPPPVSVCTLTHSRGAGDVGRWFTVHAQPGATNAQVLTAFTEARQREGQGRGRPRAPRNVAWAAFVDQDKKRGGRSWRARKEKFEAHHPEFAPFSSVQDAVTAYRRRRRRG